jgi:hypothetical protein
MLSHKTDHFDLHHEYADVPQVDEVLTGLGGFFASTYGSGRDQPGNCSALYRADQRRPSERGMPAKKKDVKQMGEPDRRLAMTAFARAAQALLFATALMLAPASRAAETIIAGGVSSASANLWPIYVGTKKGFFADADIKIDLIFRSRTAQPSSRWWSMPSM